MYSELASNSHKYNIRKMEDDSSDEELTQDSNDTNDDTAPSLGRHIQHFCCILDALFACHSLVLSNWIIMKS